MGYIGSISHGTEHEKAAYARALGTVLTLGAAVRDVAPLNRPQSLWTIVVRWVTA